MMATLEFPSLQSPSLSQDHQDQENLKLIKAVWDKYSHNWDQETKVTIIRHLRDIRETQSNRKTPSGHKLYKVDFNFGIWVLLRCIYPGQKLNSSKILLMEKYPGVDPNTFEGPGLGKMTQKEPETEMMAPSFSKQKLLEEDDSFDCSDFPIKQEEVTLVAELSEVPETQPPPSDGKMRADKLNADAVNQGRQSASKVELLNDKPSSASRPRTSRLSLKSLEPPLRAIESTFRSIIHDGSSRGHYDAFVKNKVNKRRTLADLPIKKKSKRIWTEHGSDIGTLTSSESDLDGDRSRSALSDQQYQELKNLISSTAAETRGAVSGEMLDMQTMVMKKLQSMNIEMMRRFRDSEKQISDVSRQVTALRGAIETVRRGEKDIQELEAKVVNIEEFITSL